MLEQWRSWARGIKQETFALALCLRDPRTPWWTKLLAAGVVAYALSPIDLIPDFIPLLGYLDDLILVPLGIVAVRALLPADVLADCRQRAAETLSQGRPISWAGAAMVVALWLACLALALYLAWPGWGFSGA
jgi:uncharacterized membrane protein YkvA (DUF1232 family)